jgi:hypothetical protein
MGRVGSFEGGSKTMSIHIRRTPVVAVVGVLALGAVSVAAAQDTTAAARQDTSGYQQSGNQTDTSRMGGNAARSDTSGYKYHGAPTDTALKAKPGVQTGPTAADSGRGGQDTSSYKSSGGQDTSSYKSSANQADTSGRVNRTTRSGYRYHGPGSDTALDAKAGVQTGPAASDTGRVHHRRHRMRMSAADTVVCKDGSNTANSPGGACKSHGGVDTAATWAALKARGVYPGKMGHRTSSDTSSGKTSPSRSSTSRSGMSSDTSSGMSGMSSDTGSGKSGMSSDTSSASTKRSSP